MYENEREHALHCLSSLIENSKYSVDQKTVKELWELVTGDEQNNSIRLSAFKSILSLLKHKFIELTRTEEKVLLRAMEENSEKITEVLVKGIQNLDIKNINQRIMKGIWYLRTYNDDQLLWLLEIIENYLEVNKESYPEEILKMLMTESSK